MTFNHLIYLVARPLGGLKLARYLTRSHPKIFMYHRIGTKPEAVISREIFREQMLLLKRDFNIVPLQDLIAAQDKGGIENAVAITFDDGYRDFYTSAFPILKELRIPASLFVTAGFVNEDIWLWPDQIRYCVDNALMASTVVRLGQETLSVNRGEHTCWDRIADYCLSLPEQMKHEFISDLANKLDVKLPAKPPSNYLPLTWDQVREICAEGFEVGSHSFSHPIMTKLSPEELKEELEDSKAEIEHQIQKKIQGFCYPNGQSFDFNEATKAAVREAGYKYALAAFPTRHPMKDRWAISRYAATPHLDGFEKSAYGFRYLGLQ